VVTIVEESSDDMVDGVAAVNQAVSQLLVISP